VAAEPFAASFQAKDAPRDFLGGHRESIFCVAFSPDGTLLASVSGDGVALWDVARHKKLASLAGHDLESEVLRCAFAPDPYVWQTLCRDGAPQNTDTEPHPNANANANANDSLLLATGGADGTVRLWRPQISHRPLPLLADHRLADDGSPLPSGDDLLPQVYALAFVRSWEGTGAAPGTASLLTGADDTVTLWVPQTDPPRLVRQATFRFTPATGDNGGVCRRLHGESQPVDTIMSAASVSASASTVGGPRNPNGIIYVFDAAVCEPAGLLAVALADGTVRVVSGNGRCAAILSLPGCTSHLTALAWDAKGGRIVTCVATGHLILWEIDEPTQSMGTGPRCVAVMEGGHVSGRPLYGATYAGQNEDLLLSYGVDGRLCLWDSRATGQVASPVSVLRDVPDYPIYSVVVKPGGPPWGDQAPPMCRVAVGGGNEAGFLGVPLHVYDVVSPPKEDHQAEK